LNALIILKIIVVYQILAIRICIVTHLQKESPIKSIFPQPEHNNLT